MTQPDRKDYHSCECLQEEELLSIGLPGTWLCGGCYEYQAAMRFWTDELLEESYTRDSQ